MYLLTSIKMKIYNSNFMKHTYLFEIFEYVYLVDLLYLYF